jgi:hypothetical protein
MSQLNVDSIKNRTGTGAPSFPNGAVVTGVVTATTFSGNITGTAATFSGNVSIAGTLTYEDVTNVDSLGIITGRTGVRIDAGGLVVTAGISTFSDLINAGAGLTVTGISTFSGEQRITTGAEKITRVNGNTATLTYAGSSSNVAICTNPSGNITLNVTGIPTSSDFDNHSITFAVIINSTGTARTCTAVNLNGVSKTIRFAGGSLANALSGVTTTNGYTVQSFTGINTIGSASTTTNYEVFGIVSGGFF